MPKQYVNISITTINITTIVIAIIAIKANDFETA